MPEPTNPDSMAETLRSLDEAIGEFHRIKENVQWVSTGEWPTKTADAVEQPDAEPALV
jgi:hypothetical protein